MEIAASVEEKSTIDTKAQSVFLRNYKQLNIHEIDLIHYLPEIGSFG